MDFHFIEKLRFVCVRRMNFNRSWNIYTCASLLTGCTRNRMLHNTQVSNMFFLLCFSCCCYYCCCLCSLLKAIEYKWTKKAYVLNAFKTDHIYKTANKDMKSVYRFVKFEWGTHIARARERERERITRTSLSMHGLIYCHVIQPFAYKCYGWSEKNNNLEIRVRIGNWRPGHETTMTMTTTTTLA